jgi:hypothetical protein
MKVMHLFLFQSLKTTFVPSLMNPQQLLQN